MSGCRSRSGRSPFRRRRSRPAPPSGREPPPARRPPRRRRARCSKPPPTAQAKAGTPRRRRQVPPLVATRPLPCSPGLIVVELGAIATSVDATEQHARVVPTEAHCIGERDPDVSFPRLVRHVIEVADRIRMLVVDRRRQLALV